MAFTDAVDSHYEYVKARILQQNTSRIVGGLLSAQDWPSKPVKWDAFYLLDLGEESVGKQGYSAAVPIKFHQMQWVWINKGTDTTQGIRQANRGDKYRSMQEMKGELINALFPNYCEKLSWAMANTTWTGTSKTPQEFIIWTPVDFHERWDKNSGVGYGTGALRIQDMLDVITS